MFTDVYYTKFWYSRFIIAKSGNFDSILYASSAQMHAVHMRLLSVFFDNIYIPRTHLISHMYSVEQEVVEEALSVEEFKFLSEVGCIRISTFPTLDSVGDNNRILERSSLTDEVVYASDKGFLKQIPETENITIASLNEASKNKEQFPSYARRLEIISKSLSKEVSEAIKRSEIKDVPFFHEKFIRRLKSKLSAEHFERVWRDTNSIYVTSADPAQSGLTSYFDPEYESIRFRHRPNGIDRYLFNPSCLYTFLGFFLTEEEVGTLLYGPVAKSLKFVTASGHYKAMRSEFRREYGALVSLLSRVTDGPALAGEFRLDTIRALFDRRINPPASGRASMASGLAEDMRAIGSAADFHPLGLVGGLAKPGIQVAQSLLEKADRARRFPGTTEFIKFLKKDLAEA